ncbi:MAG TPA: hypothetical protein VLF62_04575 [Candidatus Saccharimonadales bacterium]|nr:hypothetical protein [Candidatus Saccharimonadales bacterium]
MAIELLPFMQQPSPERLAVVTAEEASLATSGLSEALRGLLFKSFGYAYPVEEDGVPAGIGLQLQMPELASAEVVCDSLMADESGFNVQLLTAEAVHIYSGSTAVGQPSTVRFDFTHEEFRRLGAPDESGLSEEEAAAVSGIEYAEGLRGVVVAQPEADGLTAYLNSGRPIHRVDPS